MVLIERFQIFDMFLNLVLVASDRGLCGVFTLQQWQDRESFFGAVSPLESARSAGFLHEANVELREYFAGKRRNFNVKIDLVCGTDFQKSTWNALLKIPYGATCSYSEQATLMNSSPSYARAIGSANGANPLSIVIPCHRVVPRTGGVGGYAGGSLLKSALLNLESEQLDRRTNMGYTASITSNSCPT